MDIGTLSGFDSTVYSLEQVRCQRLTGMKAADAVGEEVPGSLRQLRTRVKRLHHELTVDLVSQRLATDASLHDVVSQHALLLAAQVRVVRELQNLRTSKVVYREASMYVRKLNVDWTRLNFSAGRF